MNELSKCFFYIMWFFPFPLLMWSNTLIHGTFIFARPFGHGRSFFLKSATELADSIAYGLFRFPLLVQFFQAMHFSDFIQNPFILGDPVCWCVTGCFSFLLCFLFPVLHCADMRSQACEASAVRWASYGLNYVSRSWDLHASSLRLPFFYRVAFAP